MTTDELIQIMEDATAALQVAVAAWRERGTEIEVLTAERDNALLRIEELENETADQAQVIAQQRDLISAMRHPEELQVVVPDWNARGGVNPNA